jgi:ADP-ribose pyrophosphatase
MGMGKKHWTAVVTGILHQNAYFKILEQQVTVTDGTQRIYYTINFPRPAVGVVVRRNDEFLLLRQYRFIVDEYVWAIPSGGVEEGETLEQAAARELEEEAGYRANSLRQIVDCYASYGCSNQRFVIFLADDVVLSSQPVDRNEVISAEWFHRDEVLAMIRKNGLVDNLSLSPLLLVLLEDAHRILRGQTDRDH